MSVDDKGRPKVYEAWLDSIDDWAKVAIPHLKNGDYDSHDESWSGFRSIPQLERLARDGWADVEAEAMDIAESVIDTVSKEVDMPAFQTRWDVTGADVDVAKYLDGDPECMIDYDMVSTPKSGRVITLVASVTVSSAVSAKAIKRRGYAVAALAFALSRMGFQIELWADHSSHGMFDSSYKSHQRILVKGANDELDPARIMFAYSHPSMLRGLGLAAMHEFPAYIWAKLQAGYGIPENPKEDMPEGTIYLPAVVSDRDVPKADVALKGYLRDLGIIE